MSHVRGSLRVITIILTLLLRMLAVFLTISVELRLGPEKMFASPRSPYRKALIMQSGAKVVDVCRQNNISGVEQNFKYRF